MNNWYIPAAVIIFICVCILYYFYVILIIKRNKVLEAFAAVDVQLKKRYDLIPNILLIAKKFMEYEKELIVEVTNLRSQALTIINDNKAINDKLAIDGKIDDKMGQIILAVENYPQLKSDKTMLTAIQTYNEVEEHIAAARRFYNSAVNRLKNAVEIFPSSLIAKMCGINAAEFYRADEYEKRIINASDYLKK